MRGYNLKMIDMAQANAEAVFELARQLATAKAPSDIAELWTAHARKQFEMLSEQTNELTALGQKIAGESAEPIMTLGRIEHRLNCFEQRNDTALEIPDLVRRNH